MDTTLEFLQPFKSHSIEFIDSEYPTAQEDLEEYLEEESRSCTIEEGGSLDMKYKEGAVNYLKSAKKRQRVQRRFRKVNSLRQLNRREESLEKGGTQRKRKHLNTRQKNLRK
ncbi:hypothetical protein Trydic_g11843 [Trypoxylus dichotomus]